jgi:malate dehydrogenase
MSLIAIVGAGPLGGELAFLLARRDVAGAVTIVDEAGQVAAGKALDIRQSSPIESFTTHVSGSNDLLSAAGAAIIVLADRHGGGEWQGEEALMLLRRLVRPGSASIVVCAGAAHCELVERAVRDAKIARSRILGSAPEALASAVRAITALEADQSPNDVSLAVLGVPPSHIVIPWGDVTIAGFAATRTLDEPARRRIAERAKHLWPPGPFTLATAAFKAIDAAIGRSRATVSAFVAPDDDGGRKARAGAVPVLPGPDGIRRLGVPTLSVHDRVALDNALML